MFFGTKKDLIYMFLIIKGLELYVYTLLTWKLKNTYDIRIRFLGLGIRKNTYLPYIWHTYFRNLFFSKNTNLTNLKMRM